MNRTSRLRTILQYINKPGVRRRRDGGYDNDTNGSRRPREKRVLKIKKKKKRPRRRFLFAGRSGPVSPIRRPKPVRPVVVRPVV